MEDGGNLVDRLYLWSVKMKHKNRCRICKATDLTKFLELGPMPLANAFLQEIQLNSPEPFYPLDIYSCNSCGLVQLLDIAEKEDLFVEYPYFSSVSKTFVEHSEKLSKEVAERFISSTASLVVEIGSNDGVLLKPMAKYNVRTLGIEPAKNVAKVAQASGVETIADFFSKQLASKIVENKGKASVILACNVFNHIDDLDDVMKGIDILLDQEGVFVFEVPYLVDLISNKAFDTMYHEMHSYFAIRPLIELFKCYNMEIFDVKRISLHTGSIRVYVRRTRTTYKMTNSVKDMIAIEQDMKLENAETYLEFAAEVERIKGCLVWLLKALKDAGKKIVGYGAPAKGNVLLNYCKIGTETLDYIVDATPYKQGLYIPGMHIPVFPTERFRDDKPDCALLLPWNFSREILEKEKRYRDKGGKFVIAIPELRVL